ncbi:MAG: CIA30 family protein [Calditrichaceae bacterium]|nr:CIA30 family protein [Calditrichaceae bacterium]
MWNLGHIFLFGLLIFSISITWDKYQKLSLLKRLVLIILLTAFLSLLIEAFQYLFKNGKPDLIDVRRNFIGAIGCFLLITPSKKMTLSILMKTVAVIAILLETIPAGIALFDEIIASKQFPVLADFENDIEISRWHGDASFIRNLQISKHGEASLYIVFGTTKYSGLVLDYFPRDWSSYNILKFDIYYPKSDSLIFTCRIHDELHIKGQQLYADRFNRRFKLQCGWNEIAIPIKDIENAPKTRKMNICKVLSIGIFTVQLPEPKTVYLDYVRLE